PSYSQIDESDMELLIAGNEDSILMVEGESRDISEDDMVSALAFGHEQIKKIIKVQQELITECGKPKMAIEQQEIDEKLLAEIDEQADKQLADIINIQDKNERGNALANLIDSVIDDLAEKYPESEYVIRQQISEKEKKMVRQMILKENRRLDGRTPAEIRPISCEVGLLPRTHGSALFTRGQTQALAVTTLGTKMDEQKLDELEGEFWKTFMLHYNFPAFSVGEVRPFRGLSRREIGHGNLAERALKNVIPAENLFPYTIRIVSDILESNGSSSMATVCAGSLSLMDAGAPIKAPVAGIAMGLIKQGDQYVILSDILGDEDHLGDMDFKVAGSATGITSFQMDIKIKGISLDIIKQALEQARVGRFHILEIMNQTIDMPREELSTYAPRILTLQVDTD
ncbi:MAG: polyribonucleotide nucleotidyltransferase, partial [bacterium]|nr:polyribonucleotide nucleotidyltransferase [bacterium]